MVNSTSDFLYTSFKYGYCKDDSERQIICYF
ncbi:hypothetical protein T08_8002 [Trichinella sp. T8]|nr:hypothetical protein T08_8002 [Trichinella sp. T8]